MNVLDLVGKNTLADVAKGDKAGHPFYGNQHVGGGGSATPHADGSGHGVAAINTAAAQHANSMTPAQRASLREAGNKRDAKVASANRERFLNITAAMRRGK